MKTDGFLLKYIFLICFIVFPVSTFSQQQNVSLKASNIKIQDLLQQISYATGYKFSYASNIIDKNKRISILAKNKNINQILPQILGTGIRYTISGEYIILLPSVSKIQKKIILNPVILPASNEKVRSKIIEQNVAQDRLQSQDLFLLKKMNVPNTGISIDSCLRDIISKNEEKMRSQIVTLIAAMTLSATSIQAQSNNNSTELSHKFAQCTFLYPMGTDGSTSGRNEYNLSLNIIGGFTGQVNGIEIGSVFNTNNYGVSGLQLGGVFNISGLKEKQAFNRGAQLAGVFNYSNGNMPVQLAGCYNGLLSNNVLQISGVANTAQTSRVQIGGVLNMAKNSEIQISGAVNIARKNSVQTGVVNIADTTVTQVGVFNISRQTKFQLGVVNVTDTAGAVLFGVLNIVKRGGVKEIELAAGDYVQGEISLRSGTRQFYTILSAGINFDKDYYSTGFGIGTKTMLSKCFDMDLELVHNNFYSSFANMSGYSGLVQFRPLLDFSCAHHVSFFAGPVLNLSLVNDNGVSINPSYVIYNVINKPAFQSDFWVGFSAGLRYKF